MHEGLRSKRRQHAYDTARRLGFENHNPSGLAKETLYGHAAGLGFTKDTPKVKCEYLHDNDCSKRGQHAYGHDGQHRS
eukprot:scaffold3945_cov70-Phaeocystis_antarctica.AAC.6